MRHWLRSYWFLLRWNLLRARDNLPFYGIVQLLLSAGVVVGYSFLIPDLTSTAALYLTGGGMTIALVTVGMVMTPNTLSYRRETGVIDYQRSLPVPRLAMMAADATVWVAVALPGMAASVVIAVLRFDLDLAPSPLVVPAILLVVVGSVSVGYTIGFLVKPMLVNVVTNAVIVVVLMFAPINFPAERLPDWLATTHEWLPFQYMAQALRETIAVPAAGVSVLPFAVMAVWAVLGLAVASRALTRRR